MADNLTAEQRKKNMQNIKSKDTKIELALRKALWSKGYRYRKNYQKLPGKPDIVLTKYKISWKRLGSTQTEIAKSKKQ
jgi:DNA mismatch endonuclease (patch repair protein)